MAFVLFALLIAASPFKRLDTVVSIVFGIGSLLFVPE